MKQTTGDLITLALKGHFDVIVHGCNCFHKMGAGIAKPIAQLFPEAHSVDKATSKGDRTKLGTFSQAEIIREDVSFTIINAYTQFDYRGRGVKVDYIALEKCFQTIAQRFPTSRIGYPMIGAGLAGGDWNTISRSIDEALKDHDHTLVVLP